MYSHVTPKFQKPYRTSPPSTVTEQPQRTLATRYLHPPASLNSDASLPCTTSQLYVGVALETSMMEVSCVTTSLSRDEKTARNYNDRIEKMRQEEFSLLQGTHVIDSGCAFIDPIWVDSTYLDHAGTTLCSKSLIDAFSRDMISNLFGNPHSASLSSQLSGRRIDDVRLKVLKFLNASPDHFEVVFVANATAGIKLVADSFRDFPRGFWYGYHRDAHTSLVGVREVATRGHRCFESDGEVETWLGGRIAGEDENVDAGVGLFAYPAQSNMNGRRLSLDWYKRLRNLSREGYRQVYSLLDAAALLSTTPLDLNDASTAPDFTVLSFNKIFGFPDLGALIMRKDSGHMLRHRKYFGGGTVEMVTCMQENWHIKKETSLHERLEDGTLPIHSIVAIDSAIDVHHRLFGTLEQVSSHTMYLTKELYQGLIDQKHGNCSSVCEIYQDPTSSYDDSTTQGPVIAFNMRDSAGSWISNAEVEKLANIKKIHLRSGGLCNPGGIASSLSLSPWEMKRNFSAGQRCGNENDIIGGKPTGMIRVSLGAMSTLKDVSTFLAFVKEFFRDTNLSMQPAIRELPLPTSFYIETVMIYPIKSCGGWKIPLDTTWSIRPEGLAWDREWCLLHQGSRVALSQKRYPKMALFKPSLDFKNGLLRIRFTGPKAPSTPSEISIPLSQDPSMFEHKASPSNGFASRVCGDSISPQIYTSDFVTDFFTNILGVPCYLARFPPQGANPSTRHAKPHLQYKASSNETKGTTVPDSASLLRSPMPLLLSNESPILAISRSSLNRLNETIKSRSPPGKAASAEVFRANIIIAEDPALPAGIEQPYIEDSWRNMTFRSSVSQDGELLPKPTYLEVLGPCRRCQMVCVDQTTAEKDEEPFVSLAKTRRVDGKVFFGVHTGLVGREGQVKVGNKVLGGGASMDIVLL